MMALDETHLVADLQRRIQAAATPATREWWTGYLKGTARFRGTKMADTRAAVAAWHRDHDLIRHTPDARFDLAVALLRQPDTEDRLAGMLYTGEWLLAEGALDWRRALPRWSTLFTDGHLADWNAVDWFCVKVLGPTIDQAGEECGRAVAAWRESDWLWQRRAGVVAFVNLAPAGDSNFPGFTTLLLEGCRTLLESDERFAQTGAGWVLRELSRAEPEAVRAFVTEHRTRFSTEALRSATRHLD